MHKRILAIFVALVLLICICAIPVSAESADEDLPYVELMDYVLSPIDGIIPGAFYVMGEYDFVGNFLYTLGEISAYGYEITYSWSGNRPNVTGVSFGNTTDNAFRNYYVDGTNLGKIRGDFKGVVGSDFGISFNSSGCYVTVHSVRVFVVDDFQAELSAVLYGNGRQVTWYPGSSISISTVGYGTINIDSWRNYDVINIAAVLGGWGITSVSARLMDNTSEMEIVIPFEMNYINLSDYNGDHVNTYFTMSCDMRGVDPATAPDSTLVISITTSVPDGQYGYIQPTSIYGSVLIDSPDKYLPWFKLIFDLLQTIELDSFVASEYAQSIYAFLSNDIYSLLKNSFSSLQSFISSSFDDFKTFWSSSLDEKITSFQEFLLALEEQSLLAEKLLWWDDVLEDLNTLVEGIPVDETTTDEMTSAGDQLAELGQQMSAGTPNISADDVNVDINSLVSAGGMTSATNLAVVVTSQPLVQAMLLIVVSLALVGFVFFGKR